VRVAPRRPHRRHGGLSSVFSLVASSVGTGILVVESLVPVGGGGPGRREAGFAMLRCPADSGAFCVP
jgi:hypothetical protein